MRSIQSVGVLVAAFALTMLFARGALATCPDQGVIMHDPPLQAGPGFTCENEEGVVWPCPNAYTIDIHAHDDCGTAGEMPGSKCVKDGMAPQTRVNFRCGVAVGSCPIQSTVNGPSAHQKWKVSPC